LDPDKRAIGNALRVFFKDGARSARVAIDYPVGHRRRRAEGIPLLLAKLNDSLATRFGAAQVGRIEAACAEHAKLEATAVDDFVALWVSES
jgi:2-methylcitrate dehydratase